jgi:hypothetical protein
MPSAASSFAISLLTVCLAVAVHAVDYTLAALQVAIAYLRECLPIERETPAAREEPYAEEPYYPPQPPPPREPAPTRHDYEPAENYLCLTISGACIGYKTINEILHYVIGGVTDTHTVRRTFAIKVASFASDFGCFAIEMRNHDAFGYSYTNQRNVRTTRFYLGKCFWVGRPPLRFTYTHADSILQCDRISDKDYRKALNYNTVVSYLEKTGELYDYYGIFGASCASGDSVVDFAAKQQDCVYSIPRHNNGGYMQEIVFHHRHWQQKVSVKLNEAGTVAECVVVQPKPRFRCW